MRLPIHPGEHLQEELELLSMSAAELARQIDVPSNRVSEILRGKRDISADSAMRLGHFFGTSAQFWMNLQAIYDLRTVEQRVGKMIKSLPTLKRMRAA